jgi:hypothetical protein
MVTWRERVEQYINLREERKPGSDKKFYGDVAKFKKKQVEFGGTEKGKIAGKLLKAALRGKEEFYATWNRLQPTLPSRLVAFIKNRIIGKLMMIWRRSKVKGKEVVSKAGDEKVEEIKAVFNQLYKSDLEKKD